jgi:hypothetical protein
MSLSRQVADRGATRAAALLQENFARRQKPQSELRPRNPFQLTEVGAKLD